MSTDNGGLDKGNVRWSSDETSSNIDVVLWEGSDLERDIIR